MLRDFRDVRPGDEQLALRFVRTWGSLGFDGMGRLDRALAVSPASDPLPWIWAHANNVRIAMDLAQFVRQQDGTAIDRYLAGLRMSKPSIAAALKVDRVLRAGPGSPKESAEMMHFAQLAFADPGNKDTTREGFVSANRTAVNVRLSVRPPGQSAFAIAHELIARIVNPNLRGLFGQIETEVDPRTGRDGLRLVTHADSLMTCLYRHLADLALGGPVLECRECGTLFVRRHARQVFCSSPPWKRGGASRCAERWKKREQRKRRRADG